MDIDANVKLNEYDQQIDCLLIEIVMPFSGSESRKICIHIYYICNVWIV